MGNLLMFLEIKMVCLFIKIGFKIETIFCRLNYFEIVRLFIKKVFFLEFWIILTYLKISLILKKLLKYYFEHFYKI